MAFRVILTCVLAVFIGHTVGTVDKIQAPTTGGEALFTAIIDAVLIYGVWNWL